MSTKEDERCRLLELPGKLRNRIYRDALVLGPGLEIPVKATGYNTEGLMRTCKTIRNETTSLFYCENHFAVEVWDYDPTALIRFTAILSSLGFSSLGSDNAKMHIEGDVKSKKPSWPNFLRLLQGIHEDKVIRIPSTPAAGLERGGQSLEDMVVAGLVVLVMQTRDLSWTRVRDLLREQRPVLGRIDAAWMEEDV
ncbi:hypothetical protein CLAFUW4_13687 [Fulvia fulva]|uniref:Uncharacterized protein n=1 Tax=Passalora fulva TaxID=5499 RepID=A0A9Q8PLG6_PASFU|nr:uncharacterized protein CLAFUR5_13536 [Fulvia fulva]KAK4610435.1 hypothetical protein CLAFUR4_13690 [Fulvia fulva]KAK4610860.1 hypothetical protein CLAFUR0_13694 [Fulvia fulva]UJO24613.1 hypothetical protein CLAFUR5_13536 [Fulvia fulva]WPV21685.1 hypothetical protein CLAFUW4_13687 [Fulvia fulva]WPV36822.1 hypothetical protein CLAFUW7_13695 [Fulvia fulva]